MRFYRLPVRVSLMFILIFPLTIALGLAGQFLFVLTAAIWHELAHIIAAWRFGLRAERMVITPIGVMAHIPGGEALTMWKRLFVLLAGPLLSLLAAGLLFFVGRAIANAGADYLLGGLRGLLYANLAVGLFNLLPFMPLDGGRIVSLLLERLLGALAACRVMRSVSKTGSVAIIALGFLQAALFPFNISLLCIGLYINKAAREAYFAQAFMIYKDMAVLGIKNSFRKPLRNKLWFATGAESLQSVFSRFNWDTFQTYRLPSGILLTEREILAYIRENGLRGSLTEAASALHACNNPLL